LLYSFIIPIYNRPQELDELLACLSVQTKPNFEVLVVEDGSADTCKHIVEKYQSKISISYFFKENAGQGFARNYGMERAKGDYFIILDSDALLDPNYLAIVDQEIKIQKLDIFGGPDRDHPSFTPIQKAISYAMTSPFTTGGIRGSKKNLGGTFHPRSFNMGLSRAVFEATKGFKITRMGEDIELSIRALSLGFKSALIPEAHIYHKRRTSFNQFYKQLFFFGRARINIGRFFPNEVKLVHLLPSIFTLAWVLSILLLFIYKPLGKLGLVGFSMYSLGLFAHSYSVTKNLIVAFLSVLAAFTQLTAYGLGFLKEKFLS
jgi:glycosyltransferase involved in cell wall biosynthesis